MCYIETYLFIQNIVQHLFKINNFLKRTKIITKFITKRISLSLLEEKIPPHCTKEKSPEAHMLQ